jgi:hypothetical protein
MISQEIKNINLSDIVSAAGVELRRRGNKSVGLCPFHSEKTASFTIFDDNRFKCFGCGEYGDAVDFVRRLHGYSFSDALKHLGIEKGPMTPEVRKSIEEDKRKREEKAAYQKRETGVAYTLGFLIRETHKVTSKIRTIEDMEQCASLIDSLHFWEHCHSILCQGNKDERRQVVKEFRHLKIIERGQFFRPEFDFIKWLRTFNGAQYGQPEN